MINKHNPIISNKEIYAACRLERMNALKSLVGIALPNSMLLQDKILGGDSIYFVSVQESQHMMKRVDSSLKVLTNNEFNALCLKVKRVFSDVASYKVGEPTTQEVADKVRREKQTMTLRPLFDRAVAKVLLYLMDPSLESNSDENSNGGRLNRSVKHCRYEIQDQHSGSTKIHIHQSSKIVIKNNVRRKKMIRENVYLTLGGKQLLSKLLDAGIMESYMNTESKQKIPFMDELLEGRLLNTVVNGLEIAAPMGIVATRFKLVRYHDDVHICYPTNGITKIIVDNMNKFLEPKGLVMDSMVAKQGSITSPFRCYGQKRELTSNAKYGTLNQSALSPLAPIIEKLFKEERDKDERIDESNSYVSAYCQYYANSQHVRVERKHLDQLIQIAITNRFGSDSEAEYDEKTPQTQETSEGVKMIRPIDFDDPARYDEMASAVDEVKVHPYDTSKPTKNTKRPKPKKRKS